MPRLDGIGLVVKDQQKSVDFYRLIGLDFPDPGSGEDHIEAEGPGGLRIMMDTEELIKSIDPDWKTPVGQRMGLAFLCLNSDEVDEIHAKVVAAGFKSHKDPWDAFWGQRYAQVQDPDGNVVDLFAWL
jgi:predicted lactoylglutathione lyase